VPELCSTTRACDVIAPLQRLWTRLHERAKPARRDGEVRLENALELEQRLVIEGDILDIGDADAALAQAVLDGARGTRRRL